MAVNFVEHLPQELALAVLNHLSFEDRARSCLVSRAWNELSREQVLGPDLVDLRPKLVNPPLPLCTRKHMKSIWGIALDNLKTLPWTTMANGPIFQDYAGQCFALLQYWGAMAAS